LGISTIKGAIFDEKGLNIPKLLELKEEFGDELVEHYKSSKYERLPKTKFFEKSSDYSVDFIVPGARPDAINKANIDKIDTKAIVPISKIPYQQKILESLYDKNILTFPEFISNAGDILSFSSRKKSKSNVSVDEHIKNNIIENTIEILKQSKQKEIPCYQYAKKKAIENLENKMERRKKHIRELEKEEL